MHNRVRLFSVVAPAMLLAGVACATAAPAASRESSPAAIATVNTSSVSPALPQGDDLTFGQDAGRVLIGLTVRPALPGPNTLLIYALPVEGPAAAADVPLSLVVGGRSVSLETCSRTCRSASVTLTGGEYIDVTADGATASFDLPALPAQDGTALLQQVQSRMHQLHTYRVDETLGPATPPLRAAYSFEAPDRMQFSFASGGTTVWVGPTRYTRDVASGAWKAEAFGVSLPVPSFVWDIPESGGTYVGAHVVGTETRRRRSDAGPDILPDLPQTPVWFRLWSDPSGLVHRASMRAQGHFMDHLYTDFDAAASINPPIQ